MAKHDDPKTLPIARPGGRDETSCDPASDCCGGVDRRDFIRIAGLGTATAALTRGAGAEQAQTEELREVLEDPDWPTLKIYGPNQVERVALPLGGIGTGTVSLTGFGSLRDWEIMNRPAKGFTPEGASTPQFVVFVDAGGERVCRLAEGPLPIQEYEASHGSDAPNARLPRFRECSYAGGYPFGRVMLKDADVPVEVHIKAFNPMIPTDAEASGIPVAVLTYELRNVTDRPLRAAVAGSLPNFIGMDAWVTERDWKGDRVPAGADRNQNRYREGEGIRGIFMESSGVPSHAPTWGTVALVTTAAGNVTYRTNWIEARWGSGILDFWDDFAADGRLDDRPSTEASNPSASLAVEVDVPARGRVDVPFLLTWHFPNRYSWSEPDADWSDADRIGNYYTTQYADAWDAAERTAPALPELQRRTSKFVRTFLASELPHEVKEAALFNASTLRTQTCFRTPDGRFFGWEGAADNRGCCHGSCTHVWNYEQTTAFLYGDLAMTMREVEFAHATDDEGVMSFRVNLPLERARDYGKAAADGQMGCIMKMYRDWQLSGDDDALARLWPKVKQALAFCWIPGGWDENRDGVMEGAQHNTMDVEYYGPNPQMGFWYLGALRAAEEMARAVGEAAFASECRILFERGSTWLDDNLFDGEYYQHRVEPPTDPSQIATSLLVGMGSENFGNPDFQLGAGCLVDQLVGQFVAHVCGLGYLGKRENIVATLESIWRYNRREHLETHFNSMRTFALAGESAILMASYPKGRPAKPFSYYSEVMTGFEYTAAVGMLQEGLTAQGLRAIRDVRERYDGLKRNPYDEAECGHHYARAMAVWAAVLALTGFHYSAVRKSMTFAGMTGRHFWSTGYAWGDCEISEPASLRLTVVEGTLPLERFALTGLGEHDFPSGHTMTSGTTVEFRF